MWRQLLVTIVGLMAFAGASRADYASTPVEMPPDDFTGSQYIDSAGCVFSRKDTGWVARRDRSGAVICGYPPSLAIRAAGSAGFDPGPAEAPPQPLMEDMLAQVLANGLRDGELVGDQRARQERLDIPTPRPRRGPAADLPALVEVIPQVQAQLAGAGGGVANSRLCALLGYDSAGNSLPGLGVDTTRGYCRGATLGLPAPALVQRSMEGQALGRVAGEDQRKGNSVPDNAKPGPVSAESTHSSTDRGKSSDTARPEVALKADMNNSDVTPEMVPHWARYILLGRYKDENLADSALRMAAELGYPVARSRGQQAENGGRMVLAGPFDDRRALIAALNDLRGRGYIGAVAR